MANLALIDVGGAIISYALWANEAHELIKRGMVTTPESLILCDVNQSAPNRFLAPNFECKYQPLLTHKGKCNRLRHGF